MLAIGAFVLFLGTSHQYTEVKAMLRERPLRSLPRPAAVMQHLTHQSSLGKAQMEALAETVLSHSNDCPMGICQSLVMCVLRKVVEEAEKTSVLDAPSVTFWAVPLLERRLKTREPAFEYEVARFMDKLVCPLLRVTQMPWTPSPGWCKQDLQWCHQTVWTMAVDAAHSARPQLAHDLATIVFELAHRDGTPFHSLEAQRVQCNALVVRMQQTAPPS